ncbi:MAG: spondin domain-containing protein [Actinomycetota bacterium]
MGDWAVVAAPAGPPPIGPGASVTFEIDSLKGARFLSWVSMLICTNDGFTGLDSVPLPARIGETEMRFTVGYDAGTELNTEAWADLVPPCAELTGFGNQGGTGVSNPALAEGAVIAMHPGIAGTGNLVRAVHGWVNPVASVTITRIG